MSAPSAPTPPVAPVSTRREVFYAAYGSNLSADRFACYIAGGTASGASRALPGARDRRLPESWHPLRLPGRVYFYGHSRTWGGAPAAFEPAAPRAPKAPAAPAARVFARAWRLGWDQLEDVMAQENARPTCALDVEQSALTEGFSMLVGAGRYDRLVCVGTLEDLPVLTFTPAVPSASVSPAAPSLAYLAHIVTGLRETFALGDPAIVHYLGHASGATTDLVGAALARGRAGHR
jgi:hypothetical protein